MAGFNLAVLGAVDHIGATNTGVIIGASPVFLALTAKTRDPRILIAAGIVVAGAALVNGADSRISALGLAIALAGPRPRGRLHAARRAAAPPPRPDAGGRLGGDPGHGRARRS